MTLKKLSAGSGYRYLTRQVAAADSTELRSRPLSDYYLAKGEAPGRWVGGGLVGIDGIAHGDVVTAEQMKNLFGEGRHPDTGCPLGRAYRPDAVAGFDLTFSPVKSVSALWAVASPEVAKSIEAAHAAAVADALTFLEEHAIFTREGTDGVRQAETRGLIAAAFTHRDSRAGDPDLHTHVAVANKVQTLQGKWLSIYGTVLHRYVVAASETYNTALEHHLRDRLGLAFVDTPHGRGKRPVREIFGVDASLSARWSERRHAIEARVDGLRAEFTATHHRAPTEKELIALAQQANLATRAPKHEPRSEAEQRATWRAEAVELLGPDGARQMVEEALGPRSELRPQVSVKWLNETAERIVLGLEGHRATWQSWHLYAEAQRQVRGVDFPADHVAGLVERLVDTVTARLINLTPDHDPLSEPTGLRRSDGTSVYRHTGADHFTSQRMLDAEQRILTAAGRPTTMLDSDEVDLTLMEVEVTGVRLNDGQHRLVRFLVGDPRQVSLALAPAGSGKTTAMNALAETARLLGLEPMGLAPSAAAAAVLGASTGMPAETLAKLAHTIDCGRDSGLGSRTLVIIDEAGMADTPTLDRVISACVRVGARVRLIGDDQQLAAVGSGGILRDIERTHGAARLDEIVRFSDPIEARASVDLRAGNRSSLGFYLDHDRVHTGDADSCLGEVLDAWHAETRAGRECLMLAPTRELVGRLNRAARAMRLRGETPHREVTLADGNRASVGDTLLTRRNDRCLGVSGTDWVKNGDRWTVTGIDRSGGLRVRHVRSRFRTVLPPEYVAEHVELGYATTVHAAQGSTADVTHGIVTGHEDRQVLYTMLTRGRDENHVHLIVNSPEGVDEEQFLPGVDEHLTAVEVLGQIVARDGAAISASTAREAATDVAAQLHEAARRYADAVTVAAARLLGNAAVDGLEGAGPGPLPWLPGIPDEVREHPQWTAYLTARNDRVIALTTEIRRSTELAESLARFDDVLTRELREAVTVWRAAEGVPAEDRSLLGPRPASPAAESYWRRLQRRIDDLYPPAVRRWEKRIAVAIGRPELRDEHTLDLARDLDRIQRDGLNADHTLQRAVQSRPLPEDHAVEALQYRVERIVRLSREVGAQVERPVHSPRAAGLGF